MAATAAEIPDKLYFRIGEVARLAGVETYVLRFWETEFPALRPGKSSSGQRLYRRREVELALRIKSLLHEQGFTIAGAKKQLQEEAGARRHGAVPAGSSAPARGGALQQLRRELKSLLADLEKPVPGRKRS